jgi:hypothetical protein
MVKVIALTYCFIPRCEASSDLDNEGLVEARDVPGVGRLVRDWV